MNLEYAFFKWGGMYKIGIRLRKMSPEIGAGIRFFWRGGILADVVSHSPQNMEPCDIQYRWVIGNIKIKKEFFGGR